MRLIGSGLSTGNDRMELSLALAESFMEERAESDRRIFGWRTVVFGFLRSRRRELRRNNDTDAILIDWHHPWLFFLAVGTMLLSCTDAFLTLILLDHGMIEVNPLMASLQGNSTALFAATKMAITGLSILILVFLSESRFFNRIRTGLILTAFFAGYACLVCYEIVSLLDLL